MANEIVDEPIDGQYECLASVVKIKLLNENAKLPEKAHEDDACYDVVATSKEVKYGGKVIEYGLGFSAEIPPGTQLDVRARSSVSKTGLILANGIGTGDEGYRGEYKAVFYHVVPELTPYEVGERVCQIQIVKRLNTSLHLVEELSETVRGDGGFGSTGTKGFGTKIPAIKFMKFTSDDGNTVAYRYQLSPTGKSYSVNFDTQDENGIWFSFHPKTGDLVPFDVITYSFDGYKFNTIGVNAIEEGKIEFEKFENSYEGYDYIYRLPFNSTFYPVKCSDTPDENGLIFRRKISPDYFEPFLTYSFDGKAFHIAKDISMYLNCLD